MPVSMRVVILLSLCGPTAGWLNGAATTPPLGYSNWNMWHNNINSSLFLEVATFMKENGFLAAGYNYITLGGIGYCNNSAPGGNITRNSSGYIQVDPIKFPGGNEGMRVLTDQIRSMGYKWGSYTEAGTAGCDGAKGSSEGFEDVDAKLFFEEWKSEYLMIDSCGVKTRPPPYGPPPNYPGNQAKWEMSKWNGILSDYQKKSGNPIVLHDCHNGCESNFAGPTLAVVPCDTTDSSQLWDLRLDGSATAMTDNLYGFCVGCGSQPEDGCGNTALRYNNGSGVGVGMQSCVVSCSGDDKQRGCAGAGVHNSGPQTFNFSSGAIRGSSGACLRVDKNVGPQVGAMMMGTNDGCNTSGAKWEAVAVGASTQLRLAQDGGSSKLCLSSNGKTVAPNADPWCIENNNMWRSNTDVLQCWPRTMMEVESMATQATLSRPGAWSFPDCLELGVPGEGSYTWEESKSVLALFAVTSSPLILGNDPRPGRMQQRLIDLYVNPDMLQVDQQYNTVFNNAGGRIWSAPTSREIWAKPLVTPAHSVAVVVLNRGGTAIGVEVEGTPLPPHCRDPNSTLGPCVGCFLDGTKPIESPCDDNTTASSGAQTISLLFDVIPRAWLGLPPTTATTTATNATTTTSAITTTNATTTTTTANATTSATTTAVMCDVFDIFATSAKGCSLGSFTGEWMADMIPPHGSRFVRISNCHLKTKTN